MMRVAVLVTITALHVASALLPTPAFHVQTKADTRMQVQAWSDFQNFFQATAAAPSEEERIGTNKREFLQSLDTLDTLNRASKDRTSLLTKMIEEKLIVNQVGIAVEKGSDDVVPTASLQDPGSQSAFETVAKGTWKVIYAPHMSTISSLFQGVFDVQYILYGDGEIQSHARYDFPVVGEGYLSVSGTYGSVDDKVSRVDFDKVWIKPLLGDDEDVPFRTYEEVPESLLKNIINEIGKSFFIDSVSVFPVSFLDNDLVVFDFELLGTRICAKKS